MTDLPIAQEEQDGRRRRKCRAHGHEWLVVLVVGKEDPVCVLCDRCGKRWPPGDMDGTS